MILLYENSLIGFYTAIYEAFYLRRMDINLLSDSHPVPGLFECVHIAADDVKSLKVETAIQKKLGLDTSAIVQHAWLSHMDGIEDCIFRYLKLAFKIGCDINDMMQSDIVSKVVKTAARVSREAHRMNQFVRFRLIGSVYAADIYPDFEVLPLIENHFANRFSDMDFIIRDRHYCKALLYSQGKSAISDMTDFVELDDLADSNTFEEMWKGYYKSMCIEARRNRRCMLNNMPLKYHRYMTEKQ